jgi:hypothetical protein
MISFLDRPSLARRVAWARAGGRELTRGDHDPAQGVAGLPAAAGVQPVPLHLP